MSTEILTAPGDPSPKSNIDFQTRASLSRPFFQPTIVDDPVGLVGFGDSSALHFALVTDPGAGRYSKLAITAKTYIHGWTVNSGRLYVLDGVELTAYDIRKGVKEESQSLLTDTEATTATNALVDLKKAEQRFEWATLLELAEDDWVRITAKQSAAPVPSAERDQLDILAAEFFRMLKSLREMTGSAGGTVAARQLVATLRKALADKRVEVAPWCFSAPVARRHSMEENQRGIFVVQGDGRLYAFDKALATKAVRKHAGQNHAELKIALLEDMKSSLRVVAYVSDGVLCLADAKTFDQRGFWSPGLTLAKGSTHTLAAVNNQIWWGTDSTVYACKYVDPNIVSMVWSSGSPWATRQVGRLNAPVSTYNPPIDPNELFDKMNVRGWIEQRTTPATPLNDGMMALLMLSDDAGKYKTPAEGTSYIVHGPFERDASAGGNRWTQIRPHHSNGMVLLSDARGASSFCRYPTATGVSQLTPQWTVAPWLSSVTAHSPLDTALSQPWPTPAFRPLVKPQADMAAWLKTTTVKAQVEQLQNVLSVIGHKNLGDQDLRFGLWHALYNNTYPSGFFPGQFFKDAKAILDVVFTSAQQQTLTTRFGQPGTAWNYFNAADYSGQFGAKNTCQVNFDPPWALTSVPANLFHSTPPLWFDPWGYNRPGDFITDQPSATYLDPVCFNGHLKLPHRRVNFDAPFKGRRWAIFTDNDPGLILKSVKPPVAGEPPPAPEPRTLRAATDPNALVVTADEDSQRTSLQVLAPKPLRLFYDAATHSLRNEAKEWGSIPNQVLAPPVMYRNPASSDLVTPTAWVVTAPDFPSARLRKLATVATTGKSDWDVFLDANRTQYGPTTTGSKTWQIEICPLPADVLPKLFLQAYGLPAS
jgi:hypothetical protein